MVVVPREWMSNVVCDAYLTSQHHEKTNAYMERTIRVWKEISEVMYDNFPVLPSCCNSAAIQGDGNRPHFFAILNGSANLGES